MRPVNAHYIQIEEQLWDTQTLFPLGHLICQVSIGPEVGMELEALACIVVAGSYLMVIGWIYRLLRKREQERERTW